jgi:hypothetical protein
MILLVSGATATVRKWPDVGELIVPGAWSKPDSLKLRPGYWAMDNGAFSGFEAEPFMGMLQNFHGRLGCRFVTAPDRVGDCFQTMQQWPFWSAVIRGVGFVPALVAQDGLLVADVPWKTVGALFIGGTTEWKLGPQARDLMAYAKSRGLWVHVGRVNSDERIWDIAGKGADSFDGSQHSWFADRRIPESQASIEAAASQMRLVI